MIERGHQHLLRPVSRRVRPDGTHDVLSQCSCGLEEQRRFNGDRPVRLKYRFGGLWFEPLDLLRLFPLPITECVCGGVPTFEPCVCGGLGVVEQNAPLTEPALDAIS